MENAMTTLCIDTEACWRIPLAAMQGTVAEIVNKDLCGANNVRGMLRWLEPGEHFDADSLLENHQLIYFMKGAGVITLGGRDYDLTKGAGIYLGPGETASIKQSGGETLKLLHLVVVRVSHQ
jgi:quercetin dioxygenase-like cupin family protein